MRGGRGRLRQAQGQSLPCWIPAQRGVLSATRPPPCGPLTGVPWNVEDGVRPFFSSVGRWSRPGARGSEILDGAGKMVVLCWWYPCYAPLQRPLKSYSQILRKSLPNSEKKAKKKMIALPSSIRLNGFLMSLSEGHQCSANILVWLTACYGQVTWGKSMRYNDWPIRQDDPEGYSLNALSEE